MVALGCLWYGLAVRHNAIIAVVPLVVWAAIISRELFPSKLGNALLSVVLRAGSLVALLALTVIGVNKWLARASSPQAVHTILIHDLVGMSLETNRLLLPNFLIEALASNDVNALTPLYTPNEVAPLFCSNRISGCFTLVTDPDKISTLWAAWLSAISRHPRAYLKHRLRVFKSEFGIERPTVCLPFWNGIVSNSLGLTFHQTKLNRSVMGILSRMEDGPLFRGWLYLVLLGALLVMFWRRLSQYRSAALLIGLSGFLYAIAYFFVTPSCDFRYHWWTVLSVFLLALLAIQRWRTSVTAKPLSG
jgi:hypothetical protein